MTEERMFTVGLIDVPAAAQPELAALHDQFAADARVFRNTRDPARMAEMMGESVLPTMKRFVEIMAAKVGLIEHLIESGQLGSGDDDDDTLRLDEDQANLFLATLRGVQALVKGMADAAAMAPPEQQALVKMLQDNVAACIAILEEYFDDEDDDAPTT